MINIHHSVVSLGGLGVTCLPQDPRFASSNPTEVDGFFQDVKILSTSPPGGTLSASVMSTANDTDDNEIVLGTVHRSLGICLTAEENLS